MYMYTTQHADLKNKSKKWKKREREKFKGNINNIKSYEDAINVQ